MNTPPPSFTGRTRTRKTKLSVKIGDAVARFMITVGGVATILAVALVCIFLLSVALPLFRSSSVSQASSASTNLPAQPLAVGADEFQTLGWSYFADGTLQIRSLHDGKEVKAYKPFQDKIPTASSFSDISSEAAFGFSDGTVRIAYLGFTTQFINPENSSDTLIKSLKPGQNIAYQNGVAQLLDSGQVRVQTFKFEAKDPIPALEGTGVKRLDYLAGSSSVTLLVLGDNGKLVLEAITSRTNLLTEETTYEKESREIDYNPENHGVPLVVAASGRGDNVYVLWPDGTFYRYDTRGTVEKPVLTQQLNLLDTPGAKITQAKFLIGKSTLIVGDSTGTLTAWFPVRPDGSKTTDGVEMVMAHRFPGNGSAVTSLASSVRSRLIASGYADGTVKLHFVTSEKNIVDIQAGQGHPVTGLAITPKDDGLIVLTDSGVSRYNVWIGHPETTVHSLFLPVWYEGYPTPEKVWQSVGGTDDFESKFGVWPLVFGTIKATTYSLIFGVPIAILAAIYTSEFLHPKTKARIKPVVETMASLPSVVLGFLAGIVIAPMMETVVTGMIACILTIPMAFLIGAYIWQLLPYKTGLILQPYRFGFTFLCLPIGLAMGWFLGPWIEHALFAGDLKLWLNFKNDKSHALDTTSPFNSSVGGWAVILFPIFAILIALGIARIVNPLLRAHAATWERHTAALMDIVKFVLGLVATLALCFLGALAVDAMGFDPRGSFVDTYVQKNSLVVGFIMGFAIIPIIYTLSEDALASVPDHLRSASLGAGATPWQTTVRIVLPTAMSGLFSAVMIGVGRAVGETMIVLMAAGNTAIMDWNIFSGFRTLSANIATEMSEAVRNSTHYRVLFLSALVLFAMTFVLNTIAEVIRQRFRKRAFQL
jgi:phosphate transport system permease protein